MLYLNNTVNFLCIHTTSFGRLSRLVSHCASAFHDSYSTASRIISLFFDILKNLHARLAKDDVDWGRLLVVLFAIEPGIEGKVAL